jgi:hypothetical protein
MILLIETQLAELDLDFCAIRMNVLNQCGNNFGRKGQFDNGKVNSRAAKQL